MNALNSCLRGCIALVSVGAAMLGCGGPTNTGAPGNSAVSQPAMPGTVFTILFENHDESAVIDNSAAPYFTELAHTYGSAAAYVEGVHPSLPNYLLLTSGSTHGVTDDADPSSHPIAGNENLADQLDAANVPWRAYMDGMSEPCQAADSGTYAVRHNPFMYYTSFTSDTARCREHDVPMEANLANDLAANRYRYVWITPDLCNDMHDCAQASADAWLHRVIPQIMASPGYQNGGAIFILFDEGNIRIGGGSSNLATIVISPNLVSAGFRSSTSYDHTSYLATVQDALGLPRLPGTMSATPMADFFQTSTSSTTNGDTTATAP